jgi:hypothetical protein
MPTTIRSAGNQRSGGVLLLYHHGVRRALGRRRLVTLPLAERRLSRLLYTPEVSRISLPRRLPIRTMRRGRSRGPCSTTFGRRFGASIRSRLLPYGPQLRIIRLRTPPAYPWRGDEGRAALRAISSRHTPGPRYRPHGTHFTMRAKRPRCGEDGRAARPERRPVSGPRGR